MAVPKLDILVIDIANSFNLGIADISVYPTGFNIVSPHLQITPPGYKAVIVEFTPRSLNLFDSEALGITCDGETKVKIPDGLYTIKYTITPAYTYYVEKTFFKVDNLLEHLDALFIGLDLTACDDSLNEKDTRKLNEINMYIQFAIACANKCANSYAIDSYQKAVKLINKYSKSHVQLKC